MKKLKLYRGIYTDDVHADIIKNKGFEEKWLIPMREKNLFHKGNIDEFYDRQSLKKEDVRTYLLGEDYETALYAAGTYEDACFYALRNIENGFVANYDVKNSEVYSGTKKPFVVSFEVPLDEVYVDAVDSLYPLSYFVEGWSKRPEQLEDVRRIWGKKTIDKYLPKLLDKDHYDANALVPLMTAEEDCILSFYNNHAIYIHGKRGVELFSSFVMYGKNNHISVTGVEEISEEQCKKVLDDMKYEKKVNLLLDFR